MSLADDIKRIVFEEHGACPKWELLGPSHEYVQESCAVWRILVRGVEAGVALGERRATSADVVRSAIPQELAAAKAEGAREEREACAQLAECYASHIAAKIRARGEKP